MVRQRPQAIIPENLTPRISATPECRPMAAGMPRVLNLKDRSEWARIPAAFSDPNVEGHPLPTPGIDSQLPCFKRFHLRVPIHIAQQTSELFKSRPVDATVLLEAFLHPRPKLVEIPTGLGHTDNGHIAIAAQRRKYLLVGQIPRGPEEDQRVGKRAIH